MSFHPTAIVSDKAKIGKNVKIGHYSIIEDDVEIGDNTEIRSHVVIADGARIGKDVRIHPCAVIATEPQDLKFGGEKTLAIIGDRTVIREYASVNRGTKESGKAEVGSDCLLMAYVHVAHDCKVGDNVVLSNLTHLGGHVTIEDWVVTGGYVKLHQFCKIGRHAFIGADAKIVKDVPPYTLMGNNPVKVAGVNKIGLKRREFTTEQINELNNFYRILLNSGLNTKDGVKKYLEERKPTKEIENCIDFIKNSDRGIYRS